MRGYHSKILSHKTKSKKEGRKEKREGDKEGKREKILWVSVGAIPRAGLWVTGIKREINDSHHGSHQGAWIIEDTDGGGMGQDRRPRGTWDTRLVLLQWVQSGWFIG